MPGPHPMELRERVITAYENGEGSYAEIAERFAVGEASVNRWLRRHRTTGSAAASPMGGSRGCLVDEAGEELIRTMFEAVPDLTLVEVCEGYEEERGVRISPQTMSDTVRRMGFTRKRGSFVRELPNERM